MLSHSLEFIKCLLINRGCNAWHPTDKDGNMRLCIYHLFYSYLLETALEFITF